MSGSDPVACVDVVGYHHRPDAALLIDAALPAARDAAAHGVRAHLERHWLHGPHIRVCLRGPAGRLAPAAAQARGRIRGYLRTAPATADPRTLLARSAVNGRAELVPGPYEPIHPHGTVLIEPADEHRLTDLLGSSAAVDLRRELLVAALDPIESSGIHLRAADESASSRVRVALAAMTAHAASYPGGLVLGAVSFRSHLEDFLHTDDPTGALRRRLDDGWDRTRGIVTDAVRAMSHGTAPDALHAAWHRWAIRAREMCRAGYRRGAVPLLPGDGYRSRARAFGPVTARRWDAERRTDYSSFHRGLLGRDWVSAIADDFGPYRFATNVLYTALVVCGVTPLDRYLAAHLLTRAAQEPGTTSTNPRSLR